MTDTGAVVIITGAARGQGAAHARRLAAEGYRVVIADVLDEPGEELAEELRGQGYSAEYSTLDVTDTLAWKHLTDELTVRGERLVGLVNNAGIIRVEGLERLTEAAWERLVKVNTTSVLLGMQAVIPLMRAGRGGSIVNVASTAALRGSPGYGGYGASKAAVVALTRTGAAELAPDGIRVNAICPGGVETPMNDDEPKGGSSSAAPLGRRAHPSEISPLISYLISDASSFVTGAAWPIDGGLTAV